MSESLRRIAELETKLQGYEGKSITEKIMLFKALQRAPRRMAEVMDEIMRQPPEQSQNRDLTRDKKLTHER